jgi:hypothetical protein
MRSVRGLAVAAAAAMVGGVVASRVLARTADAAGDGNPAVVALDDGLRGQLPGAQPAPVASFSDAERGFVPGSVYRPDLLLGPAAAVTAQETRAFDDCVGLACFRDG